jgi:hypothetical protein
MLFGRLGWSEGSAPLYSESVTVGMLYYFEARSDLVGVGMNWGKPSDDSLGEQTTGELFHRIHLAQNLAITPSIASRFNLRVASGLRARRRPSRAVCLPTLGTETQRYNPQEEM